VSGASAASSSSLNTSASISGMGGITE
jgi:hypothetical protein